MTKGSSGTGNANPPPSNSSSSLPIPGPGSGTSTPGSTSASSSIHDTASISSIAATYPSLSLKTTSGDVLVRRLMMDLAMALLPHRLDLYESWCLDALNVLGDSHFLQRFNQQKKAHHKSIAAAASDGRRNESSVSEFLLTKLGGGVSANQEKNHAIRFALAANLGDLSSSKEKSNWMRGLSSMLSDSTQVGSGGLPVDYEEVLVPEILHAAVTDICIIGGNDAVPPGFFRISKTPMNRRANINTGASGPPLYLCLKKDTNATNASAGSSSGISQTTGNATPKRNSVSSGSGVPLGRLAAAVTQVLVIYPERGEYLPPGFNVVCRGSLPCNLNIGSNAERVHLVYRREAGGNPIIDLQLVMTGRGEEIPRGFHVIERSMSGLPANLNGSGVDIRLCYKQEPARLFCLLNENNIEDAAADALSLSNIRKSLSRANSRTNFQTCSTPSVSVNTSAISSGVASLYLSKVDTEEDVAVVSNGGLFPVADALSFESQEEEPFELVNAEDGPMPTPMAVDDADDTEDVEDEDELDLAAYLAADYAYEERQAANHALRQLERRRSQCVVDNSGALVALHVRKCVLGILACISIRQGTVAELAIAGLTRLLRETDFFSEDLRGLPPPGSITTLDLSVEAVCDRLCCCVESEQSSSLEFLRVVVRHSGGRLSSQTLQMLHRTLLFLSNSLATKPTWLASGQGMPCNEPGVDSPFKVLRMMVCELVSQAESGEVAHFLPRPELFLISPDNSQHLSLRDGSDNKEDTGDEFLCEDKSKMLSILSRSGSHASGLNLKDDSSPYESLNERDVCSLVSDIVDGILDTLAQSELCDSVVQILSKTTTAGTTTSLRFWMTMAAFGRRLFVEGTLRTTFVSMCILCRQAWQGVRISGNGLPMARDLGCKLIALEGLTELCLAAGERLRASRVMGYAIRRVLVPCVLFNVSYALADHRVCLRLLRLITALWRRWRRHLRTELAVLSETLFLRLMSAPSLAVRPVLQLMAVREIGEWFERPEVLVELFANYDLGRGGASTWATFAALVRELCTLSRRAATISGTNLGSGAGADSGTTSSSSYTPNAGFLEVTSRDVQLQALEEAARLAKLLMDASGHAYLLTKDDSFRRVSLAGGAWMDDEDTVEVEEFSDDEDEGLMRSSHSQTDLSPSLGDGNSVPGSTSVSPARRIIGGRKPSILQRRAVQEAHEELFRRALQAFHNGKSLKSVLASLVKGGFMADSPQATVDFLRMYARHFDPVAIGDFLGEGGSTAEEEAYFSQVRLRYTRGVSFLGMEVEPALRLYLTGCGFRMPGEAQKIDRFVEAFVRSYWQTNNGTRVCDVSTPDAIHLLVYASIMLNTDLHRASASNDRRKNTHRKMTRDEFVSNLRGADNGKDMDRDLLIRVYDAIEANPFEMATRPTGSASSSTSEGTRRWNNFFRSTTSDGSTSTVSNAPEVLPFRAVDGKKLSADDILHRLLHRSVSNSTGDSRLISERDFARRVLHELRSVEDLLRSLAPATHPFAEVHAELRLSLHLVSYMFESAWFHFLAATEALLLAPSPIDANGGVEVQHTLLALDVLCSCLTASIFLDLEIERAAFGGLLRQYTELLVSMPHATGDEASSTLMMPPPPPTSIPSSQQQGANSSSLLSRVSQATCNGSLPVDPSERLERVAELHTLVVCIKDTLQRSANHEITQKLAARFERRARVLEQNSFFVRQGELLKCPAAVSTPIIGGPNPPAVHPAAAISNTAGGSTSSSTNQLTTSSNTTTNPSRSSSGTGSLYHFFLFSDHLILANVHSRTREYQVHLSVPLAFMDIQDCSADPSGCSLFISYAKSSFFVVAESTSSKQKWLRALSVTQANCLKREQLASGKMSTLSSITGRSDFSSLGKSKEVAPSSSTS